MKKEFFMIRLILSGMIAGGSVGTMIGEALVTMSVVDKAGAAMITLCGAAAGGVSAAIEARERYEY
jgi:hypothetical protein